MWLKIVSKLFDFNKRDLLKITFVRVIEMIKQGVWVARWSHIIILTLAGACGSVQVYGFYVNIQDSHTFVFELWGGNLQCMLNILTFRLQSLMGFMLLGNLYLENSIFHPLNRYSFGLEKKIKNRSEYKSATKKGKGELVSTLVVSNRKYQYCNLQIISLYRL